MVIGLRDRTLRKLAERYWLKNRSRSSEENWKLAESLLIKLERRYNCRRSN